MEARIIFRGEVYISGASREEIRRKWDALPLFSAEALEDAYADITEVIAIEDASTGEELSL